MLHSAFALPGAPCAAHHGTAFLPAGSGVLFFTAGESLPLRQLHNLQALRNISLRFVLPRHNRLAFPVLVVVGGTGEPRMANRVAWLTKRVKIGGQWFIRKPIVKPTGFVTEKVEHDGHSVHA